MRPAVRACLVWLRDAFDFVLDISTGILLFYTVATAVQMVFGPGFWPSVAAAITHFGPFTLLAYYVAAAVVIGFLKLATGECFVENDNADHAE